MTFTRKAITVLLVGGSFFLVPALPATALEWRNEIGTSLGLANESFSGVAIGGATLEAASVTIACNAMSYTGKLLPGPAAHKEIYKLNNCSANKACTVAPELVTNTLASTLTAGSGMTYTKIFPESGSVFIEITFGGAECALAGKQPLTGTICAKSSPKSPPFWPQFGVTSPAGSGCASTLKLGLNSATFSALTSKGLSGIRAGESWGVI